MSQHPGHPVRCLRDRFEWQARQYFDDFMGVESKALLTDSEQQVQGPVRDCVLAAAGLKVAHRQVRL
ncbi:hypothetical protein D3C81_1955740 [compost metagenome]